MNETITVNGRMLEYKIFADCDGGGAVWEWTEFYEGTVVEKHKKYWLFGKVIEKVVPKIVFILHFNIKDLHYTRADIREKIERKLELLNREKEINNGELI